MARSKKTPGPVRLGDLRASVMASRGRDATGRWYWRVRANGQTVCGMRATVAEAEAKVAALHQSPHDYAPASSVAARVRTVADLAAHWHAYQVERLAAGRIQPSTEKAYRTRAEAWQNSELGPVIVEAVTAAQVERVLLDWERLDDGARHTIRSLAAVLQSMWRWGAARGHCPPLALRRIAPPRPKQEQLVYRSHTPTREEIAEVLDRIDNDRARDALHLLSLTGARIGEAITLRVGDVRDGKLHLSGKTGRRAYPVTGELATLCARLTQGREPDESLLRITYAHTVHDAMARMWTRYPRPKEEQWSPHGLRRRCVMDLLLVTDPGTVSKLTGHSVQVLLRDYVRPSEDDLRTVVQRAGLSVAQRGDVVQFRAQSTGTQGGKTDE